MFPRLCHPDPRRCRHDENDGNTGKLRPASHSYLPRHEPGVVATILALCALLIYAGVWLIRVLGDLPFTHP
jgi:hypothetical protein